MGLRFKHCDDGHPYCRIPLRVPFNQCQSRLTFVPPDGVAYQLSGGVVFAARERNLDVVLDLAI